MIPAIVSPDGEIVYEGIDCEDTFNELRKWFMKNFDAIQEGSIPFLRVIDLKTEKDIKKAEDGTYYLKYS